MGVIASVRERMNENRRLALGLAGAGIVLACVLAWWLYPRQDDRVNTHAKAFFLNEETGARTVGPLTDVPPLPDKGGLVQAWYFTRPGATAETLGYLMKYTDKGKALLEQEIKRRGGTWPDPTFCYKNNLAGETLVRRPEKGAPWVLANTDEGKAIRDFRFADDKNATPRYVVP
jgi:hypothetical protein